MYHSDLGFTLYCGDALDVLRTLPDESVHCVVTSPPYYGLRDYGVDRQLGLEALHDCLGWAIGNPCGECYACRMVAVFREVKRVLRSDGTCWLNLGDSYAADRSYQVSDSKHKAHDFGGSNAARCPPGLKPKDLLLMPARLALALQADGWFVRRDVIWAKGLSFCDTYSGSVMPESARDRPTTAHEYLFLLTGSGTYFYDSKACKEAAIHAGRVVSYDGSQKNALLPDAVNDGRTRPGATGPRDIEVANGRNLRSVWAINPQPFPAAHFATFPEALVRPCILLGTSEKGCCPECGKPWERVVEQGESDYARLKREQGHEWTDMDAAGLERGVITRAGEGGQTRTVQGTVPSLRPAPATVLGWRPGCDCSGDGRDDTAVVPAIVLDPFLGSGTTALVACQHGRRCVGIELNPDYCELAVRRVTGNETRKLKSDQKSAADGTLNLLDWHIRAP